MGFMKNLAQIGASFIPGVGPIASSVLGGIGGSGKQGQQSYNSTQEQHAKESSSNTANVNMFDEAVEDPNFSAARLGLLPFMRQQINRANQPVYGDAQKASYLNNLNDLAQSSMQSLKAGLGARGADFSGSAFENAAGIEQQRFGKAADFFGQLPFMEEQARQERMQPWMNMATNWLGRAPISQRRTGITNESGTRTMDSTGTTKGLQTQEGPSWWKGMLSDIGNIGQYNNSVRGNGGRTILDDWNTWRKNRIPSGLGPGVQES